MQSRLFQPNNVILGIPYKIYHLLNQNGYDIFQYKHDLHGYLSAALSVMHEDAFGWEPDEDYWDKTYQGKNKFCFVITKDNMPVGYIRFYIEEENGYNYLRVRHLAVDVNYRNKNLGSVLISAFMYNANLIACQNKGISHVYVNVSSRATSFYENKYGGGFVADGLSNEVEQSDQPSMNIPSIKKSWSHYAALPFDESLIQARLNSFPTASLPTQNFSLIKR